MTSKRMLGRIKSQSAAVSSKSSQGTRIIDDLPKYDPEHLVKVPLKAMVGKLHPDFEGGKEGVGICQSLQANLS